MKVSRTDIKASTKLHPLQLCWAYSRGVGNMFSDGREEALLCVCVWGGGGGGGG